MSTITMSNTIEQGVQTMLNDHATTCVKTLSEKYGFDLNEGLRALKLDDTKVKKEKAPKTPKAKKEKAEKPAKAEKADKPKRAPTGYLLFSADVRPEIKAALEAELEEGEKLKPQATVSAIAARWNAEGDEAAQVREEYNARAKELKDAASTSESE